MTDAIHLPGSTPKGDRVPPLRGLLVAESDHEIRVRVAEGTWTFRRADIVRIVDSAVPHADPDCRPVSVDIRAGATADFTQRLRIDLTERPMTISESPSHARGDDQLHKLTEAWAAQLRLTGHPNASGTTFTYCQTKSCDGSDDGINCDSLD
ncbi:hypothetical protein ACL02S_03635 [Nocardia sp. 004]|uniref:hypothetical protein n=1 Tax=Nocardia sp. 004 TaxID=3385978 RepID=UPI0039A1C115